MPYWDDFDEAIAHVQDRYESTLDRIAIAWIQVTKAWDKWPDPSGHWDVYWTLYAVTSAIIACEYLSTAYLSVYKEFSTIYCLRDLDSRIVPSELTWQDICAAWVHNDFEGKEWTIACIDRMRQLMWDKPFDIKWAASPTEEKE